MEYCLGARRRIFAATNLRGHRNRARAPKDDRLLISALLALSHVDLVTICCLIDETRLFNDCGLNKSRRTVRDLRRYEGSRR